MIALLGLAGAATVTALLFPLTARWAWAAAALLAALWTVAVAGVVTGAPLLLAVAAATVLEPARRPPTHGFNDLVGRLVTLPIGLAGAVLVVIRVLQSDLGGDLAVFLLVFMALAVAVYLLVQADRAEHGRAARLGIVLAAAGWAAGGHPGVVVPLTAAAMVVLAAVAAGTPEPA